MLNAQNCQFIASHCKITKAPSYLYYFLCSYLHLLRFVGVAHLSSSQFAVVAVGRHNFARLISCNEYADISTS